MPIPASKMRGKQLELETQWTRDRIEENRLINRIRERVGAWRSRGYARRDADDPTAARVLDERAAASSRSSSARSRRWRRRST